MFMVFFNNNINKQKSNIRISETSNKIYYLFSQISYNLSTFIKQKFQIFLF